MPLTKRSKCRVQSTTAIPKPSHKLFADYPYPIFMELEKTYEKQKKSTHSCAFVSLQWYKDNFHKLLHVLHDLRSHDSPISITAQSFRSTNIDERSLRVMANDLQTETKSTRNKRVLASSITAPSNGPNSRHRQRRYTIDSTHQITKVNNQ